MKVFFGCKKVGAGRGKTKKDAQQKAAEDAFQKFASKAIMQFAVLTHLIVSRLILLFSYFLDDYSLVGLCKLIY